jgi:hypothetical protein
MTSYPSVGSFAEAVCEHKELLMKRIALATAVGVALLGLTAVASARTVSVPCQVGINSKGSLHAQVAGLESEGTIVTIEENEAIVFAEFSMDDELEPGAEVELWPQVDGETPPWELAEGSLPFDRNFWIMDERTGSLVRFDVTAIVKAWQAEALPELGFVLRITNAEDLSEQVPEGGGNPTLALAKQAQLTYHIQAIRPPKSKESDTPDEARPSGKRPRAEDGRGGKN